MQFPETLKTKLSKRKQEGRLRNLVNLDHLIDFWSNDYFGFAKKNFQSEHRLGSTGSRLVSGNSKLIESVESELADFFDYDSGLIYVSGLDANLGILSSIPERGDTILLDSLCHASLRDGSRLSFAKVFNFHHNDLEHLRYRLERAVGNIYVVVESVYSMDGHFAPLKEIVELCKEFNAYLIVDEAHAGGIMGDKGKGHTNELDIDDDIFIKIVTFSKSYGSIGAVVLCSKDLREYLINYSRAFIYTSALPDHGIARIRQAVIEVSKMDKERAKLLSNVNYFKSIAKHKSLNLIESFSPIQSIIIPDITDLLNKTDALVDAGFAVRAISVPTVPAGTERIRLCIHSFNTESEIKELLDHF